MAPLSDIVLYSVAHFGLSASVGFLVYWSISTIHSRIISWGSGARCHSESGMSKLALSAALSSSVLAHVLEDYFVRWF